MEPWQLENALVQVRLTIIELMVMRLHIAVMSAQSHLPPRELRTRLEAELEDIARGLETKALQRSDLAQLTSEQRALWQDEFRETIEAMKNRLRSLFP